MAIDPDAIEEIRSTQAVEYLYEKPQLMGNRTYSRILFSLDGWTENSAILGQNGKYLSGTYGCRIHKSRLLARIAELQW